MSLAKNQSLFPGMGRDVFLLTLVIGALFLIFLNLSPSGIPDSGRYSEIAREMVVSGDYVTPRVDGVRYFEKPALFFWAEAGVIKAFGLNLWVLHFPTLLFALLGCLMTYAMTRQLFGRDAAIFSSLILATSGLYFAMEHVIALDLPLTVFISGSLFAFLYATKQPVGVARCRAMWVAFALSGCAVLTKGLVGVVFPFMIAGTWIALLGEWRLLRSLYLVSGLFIFSLVVLPWHIAVQLKTPGFFHFYFIDQHLLRYATMSARRYQPNWYYVPYLLLGFFPWVVFLIQAIRFNLSHSWQLSQQRKDALFLLVWAAVIWLFFSFSKSKLVPYILPIFPPLAILTGRYLAFGLSRYTLKGVQAGLGVLVFVALFCLATFGVLARASYPIEVIRLGYVALAILAVGSGISFVTYFRARLAALVVLFVTTSLFLITMLYTVPYLDARSIMPLTNKIQPLLTQNDEVVAFREYYQDLPLNLKQRVTVVGWHSELDFGQHLDDTTAWLIDENEFWQRFHSGKRLFVVMDVRDYQEVQKTHPEQALYFLGATPRDVLITNEAS